MTAQARSSANPSVVSNLSAPALVGIGSVTAPTTPTSPAPLSSSTPGYIGVVYTFSTGGSTSADGSTPQYLFYWGDTSNSGWLSTGTAGSSHAWNSANTFPVTSQARSSTNNLVQSPVSSPLSAVIVDNVPSLSSITPINGTGASQAFQLVVFDYAGASAIEFIQGWYPTMASGGGDTTPWCHFAYYPSNNNIYLDSPSGSGWVENGALHSGSSISNGVCQIALDSTTTAVPSGNNLTLTVNITFLISNPYLEIMSATNSTGTSAGNYDGSWNKYGTWTAP